MLNTRDLEKLYQEYIMKREYQTPHSPIGNTLGKVT